MTDEFSAILKVSVITYFVRATHIEQGISI